MALGLVIRILQALLSVFTNRDSSIEINSDAYPDIKQITIKKRIRPVYGLNRSSIFHKLCKPPIMLDKLDFKVKTLPTNDTDNDTECEIWNYLCVQDKKADENSLC